MNERSNPMLLPPRSERDLADAEITFAELLQDSGYTTAHFGKWHIGGGGPERHGFDASDGNIGNEAAARYADPNPVDIFGMAERAELFMQDASASKRPFFVQLSWLALHNPENALEATKAKYADRGTRGRRINRAAITEDLDTGVGRVLDAIERLGLTENTYVIYMSDNGGTGRGTLAGSKGTLFEGGLRVPLIVRGPGIKAGSWSHVPVVGYDLYPTFLEWAGIDERPEPLEGGSLAKLLAGAVGHVERARPELVFHFPHYQNGTTPQSAIYADGYKLIRWYEDGRTSLFNIETDVLERTDLAERDADRAERLESRLQTILDELGAELPGPNPSYDPDQATTAGARRGASGGGRQPDGERRRRGGGRRRGNQPGG